MELRIGRPVVVGRLQGRMREQEQKIGHQAGVCAGTSSRSLPAVSTLFENKSTAAAATSGDGVGEAGGGGRRLTARGVVLPGVERLGRVPRVVAGNSGRGPGKKPEVVCCQVDKVGRSDQRGSREREYVQESETRV
jgi:hypothetical protein